MTASMVQASVVMWMPISWAIYGPKVWVVTERTRSPIQVAEMSFLCSVHGLSLKDRMRNSVIRERFRAELLLFRIEMSQFIIEHVYLANE